MAFHIHIPDNLEFKDYIAICQTARTWADGYDRKDKARLRAALANEIVLDYTGVVPNWTPRTLKADAFVDDWLSEEHLGLKALATQHLLALPYFESVSETEIVVQWQQVASHGRRVYGEDYSRPQCKIGATSVGYSYMQHTFVKEQGLWKISRIVPSVVYQTGSFEEMRKEEGS